MRVVMSDGVGLEVLGLGPRDAPGLLLVHGFGGAKEDFADHLAALARGHRVVTFDLRGRQGSAVLLWITDLGQGSQGNSSVSITEAKVTA